MLRATTACTFEHFNLNFQKCSDNGVFSTFLLRATTVCTFSNISTSKSAPNLRCFVFTFWLRNLLRATTACNYFLSADHMASLLFDPPEPQNIGKIPCFVTFYLFSHLDLRSSDTFSSLIFFLLPFPPLTLSPLLFFPFVPKLSEV